MEVGKLTVEVRTVLGKNESRRLRAQGKVPGVMYDAGRRESATPTGRPSG